ncbi:MAG: secretin N-terminal domain-containing protein [Planctomycetota bacterium]
MKTAADPEGKSPKTVKIVFEPAPVGPVTTEAHFLTNTAVPENGEDVIDMTLPDTITLVQLLDLAGKYMGLNYVYDPREVPNQSFALKLHGKLQGQMKVKNLYALLQSVLGSAGLAMIRQEENLVAVVKIDKALETQPELVDTSVSTLQLGDTVVTRAFNIQHVNVVSVISLLQDMKLSVAATAIEKTSVLLVTCHADRMNRVEQLVEMIDRPGRPTECWFRRLEYTTAPPLVAKIRTLAQELEGIAVTRMSATVKPTAKPVIATAPKPPRSGGKRPVYLDIDERTNRILMVGFAEELTQIEKLIDTLDVVQEDPRSPQIYDVRNIDAKQALEKLEKLEILKTTGSDAPRAEGVAGGGTLADEPLVTVLEATNQLLVRATADQQTQIAEFLNYIDVVPESVKTLAFYEIEHIEAAKAREILEELDLVSVSGASVVSTFEPGPNEPAISRVHRGRAERPKEFRTDRAQVVVVEESNALFVTATITQHEHLSKIIEYVDRKIPAEELSYRIYPIENSSPEHISDMLEQLIGKTTIDGKDGNEGKIVRDTEPQENITIVPDPNTFSLLVHASQRDHEWIEDLITKLDKRRPQVLIDVTLVEVSRTDTFEYDLNLVANAKDAVVGNVVIDPITRAAGSKLEAGFNLTDQDGNPTGQTQVFYSDDKVQALLTAIRRKNYGRVLAKPKIMVDDGQQGRIVTTDETTYIKESIQIPQTGTPITTRDFVPIEASIQLEITPHISEGDLLRLFVHMSRDDFGSRPLSGAPPDKAGSEIETTVFVPDQHTVILGGLVKLNQSKGGSKVPILGDVPLIGAAFRSVNNSDTEKKLYVFLKANIVRPYEESRLVDLRKISEEHQAAFEKSESEFQKIEDIPGIKPKPMQPERVLNDYQ